MNLPPLEIGALLRSHGLSPKKGLGQNFLADPVALERIVAAAHIPPHAQVLEVGPGLGSLTRYLACSAQRVVAVELDRALLPVLADTLAGFANVTLVQGDILALDPAALMQTAGYWVVANIPYYITSALIRHLLEAKLKPARVVLTVQREVAERVCALPGEMSLLALGVQVYGRPRLALRIPAGAFYPPPKVDSAVVDIELYGEPRIPPAALDTFFRLAKAGFGQKRKTLRNSLSGGLGLAPARAEALLHTANIDPQRRAETLDLDEWSRLTSAFTAAAPET